MFSPLRSQKNSAFMKCAIYLPVIYPMQLWWYWSWYLFINQTFDLSSSFFEQIRFGFKLQRAAHVHNISSTCCSNETGRLFFSILKLLIQLIACSTWIGSLTTSLVFLTYPKVIWLFIGAHGGTSRLQIWRSSSSLIWKPLPVITWLPHSKISSLVMYLSEALPT